MEHGDEVWILRHAEAEPSRGADGERRLTPAGEEAASAVGAALAALGLRAERVLTSPLARARRTAALAAAAMAPGETAPTVEMDRRLAPGGDPRGLVEDLRLAGELPALIVGHNPDVGNLVFLLTGKVVAMGTAALVRIALDGEGRGRILESP